MIAVPSESVIAQPPPGSVPIEGEITEGKNEVSIYGFAMLDSGYNFGQINSNWFDVERPTQLPSFTNQYAPSGNVFAGVRQTRFGVKSSTTTPHGDLNTVFEFELFGTGVDAGQTTFRLRHAYGELGQSAPDRPGAPSWTSMSSPTLWSTGGRAAWSSFATCSCAGCRSERRWRRHDRSRETRRQR